MCLGIPGKIVEIYTAGALRMGKVDFGGAAREACLEYLPDAQIGDYTVIHVGFAITRLTETEAQESLALFDEMADAMEELGVDPESPSAMADA